MGVARGWGDSPRLGAVVRQPPTIMTLPEMDRFLLGRKFHSVYHRQSVWTAPGREVANFCLAIARFVKIGPEVVIFPSITIPMEQ